VWRPTGTITPVLDSARAAIDKAAAGQ
jgi:hypothetical protein